MTLFNQGEFALAQDHLEQGIALYIPRQHRALASRMGADLGVASLSMLAFAFWTLGYPDRGLKRHGEALALTQEVSQSPDLANTLANAAWLHVFRRERQATLERTEALVAFCNERGFAQFLAYGPILRGWVLAEEGQGEEGISQMRQGITAWQATGAELWQSCFLTLLADAYGKVGQPEEGLTVLTEVSAKVNKTGERWYEAELYRIKGELTLQKGARDWGLETSSSSPQVPSLKPQVSSGVAREAEGYFLTAIDIARQQQAKSWELRASTSLARLWQSQGKKAEAHKLLSEIYNWFTEGFETKDLQEAKALIEELNPLIPSCRS
jgi:adenylate cyclase